MRLGHAQPSKQTSGFSVVSALGESEKVVFSDPAVSIGGELLASFTVLLLASCAWR